MNEVRLIEAAAQGQDAGEANWCCHLIPTGAINLRTRCNILDDRRVDGKVVFLTSLEPTWEPAVILPSNEIKKFRKRKRSQVERIH
ncbi:Hypothetical protein PHPALM_19670 [Phytophthora palmivora]|uniref:Uncharacterized protein n=1 Tax=Phytophthora palmivora TaxID=4796 RepID=A0A2P4XGU5_9STRA|nr:Hypothetical protein PHPALM_19670 [Phytophthora palmivora]